MKKFINVISVVALICGAVAVHAQSMTAKVRVNVPQPDLTIEKFLFPPTNDKALRVRVVNSGNAASTPCVLRLTVRKINGVAVGRVTEIKLLPIPPGKDKWVVINAKSILPNNVSLEATTFKLNADATETVAESDEANNEIWHNQ
jgi:hypothetical protein